MTNTQNNYPSVDFYFKVQVEGIHEKHEAGFREVSGLDVKIETEVIEEAGENQFSRKLPEALKHSNLVLERGTLVGTSFITWINKAVQNFTLEPKKANVILMDGNGETLINWTFHNAYPVAVKISDLNISENKYAIEMLELAYDYFERADQPIKPS